MRQRYRQKISGPILDRIDLHIEVPRVEVEKLASGYLSESSESVQMRVQTARDIQSERFKDEPIMTNAEMSSALVKKYCELVVEKNN